MKLKPFPLILTLAFFMAQSLWASVNIFIQPQNQTVLVGSNATFTGTTTTSSGETITGYAWLRSANSQGPFNSIPGANGATFTVSNSSASDAGYYFLRVNYRSGTNTAIAASTLVTLAVLDQARITAQPVGLTSATGTSASFLVTAEGGAPLGYQWRFNGINLVDGLRVAGANSSNLTVTALLTNDTGAYTVLATNSYSSATSQVAILTVLMPPAITVQPVDVIALTGSNITLSASVEGSPLLVYRWRKDDVNLNNGGRLSGATSNILVISGATTNDTGAYSLSVTNAIGSANSDSAAVTVLAPPIITSATNAVGRQGAPFLFALTAGGSPPITFAAEGLPDGLALNATNGLVSGVPAVAGGFEVAVSAANAALTTTGRLALTFTTGIPGITSPTNAAGKQGEVFTYSITASNESTKFDAIGLPVGLHFDPVSGTISGPSIESGLFNITLIAGNSFGFSSTILALNLTSSIPVVANGFVTSTESDTNFTYAIVADNSPTFYGATGLPLGLTVNTNTGVITGTTVLGGTNNVVLSARNAWGVGTNILQIAVGYKPITNLVITDVTWTYSAPYLLDFTFSLRTDRDPSIGQAVVRPPNQVAVVCLEGNLSQKSRVAIGNE
ncbi:MAG: immunoglobulin domain-containing protein, partial [Verrucomicrobiota bacterium]